jgi:hypothetical protein
LVGSFLGEVVVAAAVEDAVEGVSSMAIFFPVEIVVTGGGMKESNAFMNRFLRPSTHIFSSATGVDDEDEVVVEVALASDGLEEVVEDAVAVDAAVLVLLPPPNPNPEKISSNAFEVRSSASDINVSASSTASIPLIKPNELKNPPLFLGGAVVTLSAMAMASSASAITESNSVRNSVLEAMERRLDSCSVLEGAESLASLLLSPPLPPPPKKPPNNPPPPPPPPPPLISISFFLCSLFLCRSALRSSFVVAVDDDAEDADAVTVGKVGVGFSQVLSPVTVLK